MQVYTTKMKYFSGNRGFLIECQNITIKKIKSVAYSSQGSHTSQLLQLSEK